MIRSSRRPLRLRPSASTADRDPHPAAENPVPRTRALPILGAVNTERTIRVTVRGSFDNLTDAQKAELITVGDQHADILAVSYTEDGHLTYDLAARPFFTFRFAETVTAEKDIPQVTARAEAKAAAWMTARGYGFKRLTSQTVDMSEVPLGPRGRRLKS